MCVTHEVLMTVEKEEEVLYRVVLWGKRRERGGRGKVEGKVGMGSGEKGKDKGKTKGHEEGSDEEGRK